MSKQKDDGGVWDKGAFSVEEAMEFLSVKRSTIYALVEQGHLIASKLGRRRVISKESCVQVLEKGAVEPVPGRPPHDGRSA